MLYGRALTAPLVGPGSLLRSHVTASKRGQYTLYKACSPQKSVYHVGLVLSKARPLPNAIYSENKSKSTPRKTKVALDAVKEKSRLRHEAQPKVTDTRHKASSSTAASNPIASKAVHQSANGVQEPTLQGYGDIEPRATTSSDTTVAEASPEEAASIVPPAQRAQWRSHMGQLTSRTVDYREYLSRTKFPVELYAAASTGQYHILAYTATAFSVFQVMFNMSTYASMSGGRPLILGAGMAVSLLWLGLGWWFACAPAKLIRSIHVLPSATAASNPLAHGPLLELEIEPFFYWGRGKTFQMPASSLSRDIPVAPTARRLLVKYGIERLGYGDEPKAWRGWGGVVLDTVNVVMRRNFVYIATPTRGQWKVALPGRHNLGAGRALDEVVHLDESKKKLVRQMFG